MRPELPLDVEFIIDRIEKAGYRADIVGGCVRDMMLGRVPSDYDITTNATPARVEQIFRDMRVIETGIKHGTVTLMINGSPYEITTYRIDGEYVDSRHPESVSFADDIREDLARRDFTVNAMAYSPSHGFTDEFSGIADIERRLIRAVGSPKLRFSEDALRILRAIRFASVLDFGIEENTAKAIHSEKWRLKEVSAERILVELKKLIAGKRAHTILKEYGDVIAEVLPELSEMRLPSEDAFCALTAEERAVAVFRLSADIGAWLSAAARLHSDNKLRDRIRDILSAIPDFRSTDKSFLGAYLVGKGNDVISPAIKVSLSLGLTDSITAECLRALMSENIPRTPADLPIGGKDLLALGISGKRLGRVLSELVVRVAEGRIGCERELLLSEATKIE